MIIFDTKRYIINAIENLESLSLMDIKRANNYNINQRNFARYRAEFALRLLKKLLKS